MNLTAQPHVAFRTDVRRGVAEIAELPATFFSRGDARLQTRVGAKARIAHLQWLKNVLLRKHVEWHAAHTSNNLAQGNETDVAVRKTGSRRIAEWFGDESLDGFVVSGPTFAQIEVRRVAGDVRQ